MIDQEAREAHYHAALINAIKDYLSNNRNIEIRHIFREANSCASKLAKMGHMPSGILFSDNLPTCISRVPGGSIRRN